MKWKTNKRRAQNIAFFYLWHFSTLSWLNIISISLELVDRIPDCWIVFYSLKSRTNFCFEFSHVHCICSCANTCEWRSNFVKSNICSLWDFIAWKENLIDSFIFELNTISRIFFSLPFFFQRIYNYINYLYVKKC